MNQIRPVIVLLALALLAAAPACASGPTASGNPWVEMPEYPAGRYLVYPPLDPPAGPVPLCLALHGHGGDAMSYGRVWHEAFAGAYLVVAPQAPLKQRMGHSVSTWHASTDRDYLLAIFDQVQKKWSIDAARSVVAGYSAGAAAASELARRRRSQLGGLILHAAPATGSLEELKGLHVFLLAGERDTGFSPARALQLRDRLTGLGIPAQVQIVEGADHVSVYAKVKSAAAWALRNFALPE